MKLRLRTPDDFHLHVRQGALLAPLVKHSARWCARALVMPNTVPPVRTAADAVRYREEIESVGTGLVPLMTIKLHDETSPDDIRAAARAGVVAAKLYPRGVTTNAEDGVGMESFPGTLAKTLAAMEDVGMVLSLHGEKPRVCCLDREEAFLPVVEDLVQGYPKLRIVLEHISTVQAVQMVERIPSGNLAATITVHHLLLTLDDVIGESIRPHHFCKPIAKGNLERFVLRARAVSGDPRFFLGTDSAPHPVSAKECAAGCAGIFTAPVALPLLTHVFEEEGALRRLEDFTSRFGAEFYRLPLNRERIALSRTSWTVPACIDGIVPFLAGQTLSWQIASP